MSDPSEHYKPFAKSIGIFIGIVILWAGSLGLFLAGKSIYNMWSQDSAESGN